MPAVQQDDVEMEQTSTIQQCTEQSSSEVVKVGQNSVEH